MDAAGHQAILERERADDRLERAGGTERMAGGAFGGAAGRGGPEDAGHRAALGAVVAGRAGAVQIDIVDGAGVEFRGGQGRLHRAARAVAFGMRRRHMIGVARFADAEQQNIVVVEIVSRAFEQRESRRFTDGDAIARDVEWPAGRGRGQLQGLKSVERGQA